MRLLIEALIKGRGRGRGKGGVVTWPVRVGQVHRNVKTLAGATVCVCGLVCNSVCECVCVCVCVFSIQLEHLHQAVAYF